MIMTYLAVTIHTYTHFSQGEEEAFMALVCIVFQYTKRRCHSLAIVMGLWPGPVQKRHRRIDREGGEDGLGFEIMCERRGLVLGIRLRKGSAAYRDQTPTEPHHLSALRWMQTFGRAIVLVKEVLMSSCSQPASCYTRQHFHTPSQPLSNHLNLSKLHSSSKLLSSIIKQTQLFSCSTHN